MKRRDFFMAAGATAAFPAFGFSKPDSNKEETGFYIEWIRYRLTVGAKKNSVRDFYKNAAIPALKKMGISPVGVFNVKFGPNDPTLHVFIPHKNIESFLNLPAMMLDNVDLMKAADEFLNSPMSDPSYVRMEKTLLKAFKNFPMINVPTAMMGNNSRIYELRTYESHNIKKAKKKVEMFNEGGEIDIFNKTGFTPVFYGETLAGTMMPCLTYMLAFNDMDERDKCWSAFGNSPDWKKLAAEDQYKDTVSNITDVFLSPDGCSEV
jgi:hypothetical protein